MTLETLHERLRIVLPAEYRECYEDVQPVSMGSAGLKYDAAGRVAWDEIWGSFCDLAMAGGPPHRGTLLLPGTLEEIAAQPELYRKVTAEICRGIRMVTDHVAVEASQNPGWVRVLCPKAGMAGWLTPAIAMENVSARLIDEQAFELPAGPAYRMEKEIKNVITSVAKTCHYFGDHLASGQQKTIAALFAEQPLLQPASASDWAGVECASVREAIWMMRALAVCHVLARREQTTLFVPSGERAAAEVERVRRLFMQSDSNGVPR